MKRKITPLSHPLLAILAFAFSLATQAQYLDIDDGSPANLYRTPIGKNYIRLVNPALPWGKTAGSHSVSPTGAATYTIPITLPPGTAGMVPGLSINYNSQGGEGPLGIGWGITGMSAISRVQKDIIHDGKVEPIKWDQQDPIALNGMRLRLMSGTHLATGAIYGQEVEDFSKIYLKNFEGQPYFEVWTKDGFIHRYGYSANSRISHTNGTVFSWLLDQVRDLSGNYYSIEYAMHNGEKVMRFIRYTGNASSVPALAAYWQIGFEYETRSEKNTHYIQGLALKREALLRRIIIKKNSSPDIAKKYYLNYANIDNHSLLREITEVGKNGTTLNSTVIQYGDLDEHYSATPSIYDGPEDTKWASGDFNGDGITDMVSFNQTGSGFPGLIEEYGSMTIWRNNGDGTSFSSYLSHTFSPPIHLVNGTSQQALRAFDYNGDGIDDIIVLRMQVEGDFVRFKRIEIYESPFTQGGPLPAPNIIAIPDAINIFDPGLAREPFIVGDFNGDGRIDFITTHDRQENGEYDFHKSYLSLSGGPTLDELGGSFMDGIVEIHAIDLDGDGTSEIFKTDPGPGSNGTNIYYFDIFDSETGEGWKVSTIINGGWDMIYEGERYHERFPGDYNGDGKTDFLRYDIDDHQWKVYYSNGLSHGNELVLPWDIDTNQLLNNIVTGDFNADGLCDFIQMKKANESSTSSTIVYYKSTGGGFVNDLLTNTGFEIDGGTPIYLGDFNGDGKADMLYRSDESTSEPMQLVQIDPGSTNRLAAMISDGYAYNTEFAYAPITNNDIYTKGEAETYPLCKTQLPIHVVWEVTVPDGIGQAMSAADDLITHYTYRDGVIHKQGRGFLGFMQITSNDNVNPNVYRSQDYYIQGTVFLPFATYGLTVAGSNNIGSHRVNGEFVSLSNNRWWFRTNWTRDQDFINQASTHVSFVYDSWGNTTTAFEVIGEDLNGGGTSQHAITTNHTYGTVHPLANAGKPTSVEVYHHRDQEAVVSKKTNYTYLNGGHLLQKTIAWPGMARELCTEYSNWNDYGQPERTTLSSPGELTIVNDHIYDDKGRYVEETVNPLNQHAYAEYDEFSGKPLSSISVDGLSTGYAYDAFYRPIENTDALGNTETITYTWDLQTTGAGTGTTSVENAWYHVTKSKPGNPTVTSWHDILDRQRKVQTVGFGNQPACTVTSYERFGGVKTTTTPFENTSQAVVTTNTYHPDLNYLTGTSNSAGTISYNYTNTPGSNSLTKHQKITTTTPSGSTWKKTDMAGKVIQSHDDGGDLHFAYDSWGNVRTVNNGSSDIEIITYDAYGRQATLNPSSSGAWQYTYNAYGQLVSQKDPVNNVQTTVYDVMGRVTQESGPEGVTTYNYVTTGNGLNQLASITGFNGIVKYYTYDSYNRLQETESVMGFPMTCSYTYNSHGRLAETYYSTGFGIQNVYDGNGYLWKKNYVDGNGLQLLMELDDQDHMGLPTDFSLGNGQSSTVAYNTYGMPEHYYTSGIQDLELFWNPGTGNLISRTEGTRTEEFVYDNLQRLQSSQVTFNGNNLALCDAGINDRGDIEDKHDAGTLYDYYGLYQVRHVKNDYWEIPGPTQNVTYTAFNEPDEITENGTKIEFVYGPAKSRMQSRFYLNGPGTFSELRHYLPEMGYEVVKTGSEEHHLYYVPLTANTIAILKHGAEPNSSGPLVDFYYVYTDHLGSWLKFTDDQGAIIAHQDFDAWGRRRIPQSWDYPGSAPSQPWIIRGYTGHEHLDEVGIIHMNGRLYDPVIGRMFNPDNVVQAPYHSQGYNRYSYAFNNPVKYTDPSGETNTYIHSGSYSSTSSYAYGGYSGYNSYASSWGSYGGQGDGYSYSASYSWESGYYSHNYVSESGWNKTYHTDYGSRNVFNYSYSFATVEGARASGGYSWDFSYNGHSSYTVPNVEAMVRDMRALNNTFTYDAGLFEFSTAFVGAGLSVGEKVFYDPKANTWTGKNFKTYSMDWGGNQYTGGKYKFAQRVKNNLKWAGRALGVYNAFEINNAHNAGKVSDAQMILEQSSNVFSTFGGLYGAAWGIGWEAGRWITEIPGYGEYVRTPLQEFLGILPEEPVCEICPLLMQNRQ